MLRFVSTTFLAVIVVLLFSTAGHTQSISSNIPEGYVLKEVTVGDMTIEYLERELSAEELAIIAPAAGPVDENPQPFVGPRNRELKAEVWATQDFE